MAGQQSSQGVFLYLGTGTTALTYVRSVTGPGLQRDVIDVTHLQSTNQWREFLAGLKHGGEISASLWYAPDDATQQTLTDMWASNTASNFSVKFNDGASGQSFAFSAFCTNFTPTAATGEAQSAEVTLHITGAPTIPT